MPGYAACFDKLWDSAIPWHLLRYFPTAEELRAAGVTTLCHSLRQAGIRFQQRTVKKILASMISVLPIDLNQTDGADLLTALNGLQAIGRAVV